MDRPTANTATGRLFFHAIITIFDFVNILPFGKRVSKKYLAPSIYSYPYWRLKSNIRFYKGVFCLFGHPLALTYLYICIVVSADGRPGFAWEWNLMRPNVI